MAGPQPELLLAERQFQTTSLTVAATASTASTIFSTIGGMAAPGNFWYAGTASSGNGAVVLSATIQPALYPPPDSIISNYSTGAGVGITAQSVSASLASGSFFTTMAMISGNGAQIALGPVLAFQISMSNSVASTAAFTLGVGYHRRVN